jgi:predicted extracellular nuclease
MGDLNDGPNDIAPRQVLGADSLRSDSLPLFSPFLPYHADITQGSYNYRGSWQYIDHLLFSTNVFAEKSKLRYVEGSARAERFEFLLEQEGRFAGTPWRSFAGNRYLGGYSDHLPVSAQFELHK